MKHVKGKLPEMATHITKKSKWDVKLEFDGDSSILLLADGWKEFAKTHFLKENDLVIFKHLGAFQFKVSIYVGQTGGQNPTGFYIRKRECDDGEIRNQETDHRTSDPDGNIQPARKKTRSQGLIIVVLYQLVLDMCLYLLQFIADFRLC